MGAEPDVGTVGMKVFPIERTAATAPRAILGVNATNIARGQLARAGLMAPRIVEHEHEAACARALAQVVADLLNLGVDARGTASLVVSGGRTPARFLKVLGGLPVDWSAVVVTLADERWVPETHPDSNARLLQETLFANGASKARFLSLKSEHRAAQEAEPAIEARLRAIEPPFDAVVLGMGTDGHTASLFPDAPGLRGALCPPEGAHCRAMRSPSAPHDRMTLTLPALIDAREVFVHLVGPVKWRVLQQALGGRDVEAMPIRGVLFQEQVPVSIYYAAEELR